MWKSGPQHLKFKGSQAEDGVNDHGLMRSGELLPIWVEITVLDGLMGLFRIKQLNVSYGINSLLYLLLEFPPAFSVAPPHIRGRLFIHSFFDAFPSQPAAKTWCCQFFGWCPGCVSLSPLPVFFPPFLSYALESIYPPVTGCVWAGLERCPEFCALTEQMGKQKGPHAKQANMGSGTAGKWLFPEIASSLLYKYTVSRFPPTPTPRWIWKSLDRIEK